MFVSATLGKVFFFQPTVGNVQRKLILCQNKKNFIYFIKLSSVNKQHLMKAEASNGRFVNMNFGEEKMKTEEKDQFPGYLFQKRGKRKEIEDTSQFLGCLLDVRSPGTAL